MNIKLIKNGRFFDKIILGTREVKKCYCTTKSTPTTTLLSHKENGAMAATTEDEKVAAAGWVNDDGGGAPLRWMHRRGWRK